MTVKLLTEQHLEFLSLKGGCTGSSESTLSKCHIVGNLMHWLNYHKIRKAFSKFYHEYSELIVKCNIGLKTLLQQDISEPIFHGDLIYKFKRFVGKPNFSDQLKKIIKRYKKLDKTLRYFCLVLLCFRAHLYIAALWSPAGKGLTSWLSFVMSNCDFVTFP